MQFHITPRTADMTAAAVRPHCIHHIDAAYCVTRHTLRGLCVCLCIGTRVSCAETDEPMLSRFDCCGPKEPCTGSRVRSAATWRIRLNDPFAAAMRPHVTLVWPLVIRRTDGGGRRAGRESRCRNEKYNTFGSVSWPRRMTSFSAGGALLALQN